MKASVVIPTFNRAHLILNTINTVLAQDYQPIEIIVVDDGSTDNTRDILTPLINKGVLIFKELSHRGRPAPARNVGLSLATGDVVFLLDSDDLMLPGKISSTVRAFQKAGYQNIGFCCTDFLLRKNDGGEYTHFSSPYYFKFREVPKHKVDEGISLIASRDAYNALLSANYVGTSSVALTKEIVHAGFRFDESLTNSDDYDMWLRLAREYDVLVMESPLHAYTESTDGVLGTSMRSGSKWRTNIKILERELKIISDDDCRQSARERLNDNYRALFQSALTNKQWVEALKSLLGAVTSDFSGSIIWLWRKIQRKLQRKISKFHNVS
jgi:glycosyltransferase involved in cell wall biosynthesis